MYYHPLIGILIFFGAIILSFFLGKYAYIKYKRNLNNENLELLKTTNKSAAPPQGEITAPDAPWLKK